MDVFNTQKYASLTNGNYAGVEGSYMKATNQVWGTGVLSSTQTTYSATSAILVLQNTLTGLYKGAGKVATVLGEGSTFVVPDFFRMTIVTADAGMTSFQWAVAEDSILRYSSGGQQPVAPALACNNVLASGNPGYAPKGNVFVGNLVCAAESTNVIHVGRGSNKTVTTAPLFLAGDECMFAFGNMASAVQGTKGGGTSGTNPANYRSSVAACGAPPQGSIVLHAWFPGATTGVTFEYEVGWWEIPL
jgi:hypothetical protein